MNELNIKYKVDSKIEKYFNKNLLSFYAGLNLRTNHFEQENIMSSLSMWNET